MSNHSLLAISDDRVPYKVKHNNQIYYLSYDHIGSLKQVTDANGQTVKSIIYSSYGSIIEDMNYDSFGNIINDTNPSNAETLNIPLGFAGGLYDKDTKLTKFGYREYDSYTGRWTSKDPIRYEGGDSNLYGYVLNDPVNGVDVEGLAPKVSPKVCVAIGTIKGLKQIDACNKIIQAAYQEWLWSFGQDKTFERMCPNGKELCAGGCIVNKLCEAVVNECTDPSNLPKPTPKGK